MCIYIYCSNASGLAWVVPLIIPVACAPREFPKAAEATKRRPAQSDRAGGGGFELFMA